MTWPTTSDYMLPFEFAEECSSLFCVWLVGFYEPSRSWLLATLAFSKFCRDKLILGCLSSDGFNQLSVDEENKSEVTELNNGIVCQPRHLPRYNSSPVHHNRPGPLISKVKFTRVLEFNDSLPPWDLARRAFQGQVHVHSVVFCRNVDRSLSLQRNVSKLTYGTSFMGPFVVSTP